uniref:Glycerol kinase 5 n=1 Tax=Ditylenchus dipsaci TaxID=166011 RepID=A0A915DBA1_9BILA
MEQFQNLVKCAIARIPDLSQLISLALCCQRNTFVTWNKKTLETCHNLITWKDGRAKQACASWNSSWTIKALNVVGTVAHFLTRSERFKAAKMFSFIDAMVTHRFLVTLNHENSTAMRELLADGDLALGCLDTWLISKMTNGKVFVTEPSSASATGMYDPFMGDWGKFILRIVDFPLDVLPELVETAQQVAISDPHIFGIPVKISSSLGDSQAAAFGSGCIKKNSVKISLGTGTFVDYVSGGEIHASMKGMYPLVGWRIHKKSCYLVEGRDNYTSKSVQQAGLMQLFTNVEDTSDIAEEVVAEPDLRFLPNFDEIRTPVDVESAFLGWKSTTTKAQMLRALLESIAFRVYHIWEVLCDEITVDLDNCVIRVCGGRVAENQFSGAKGAVLLAGIATGTWTMKSIESGQFLEIEKVFSPQEKRERH